MLFPLNKSHLSVLCAPFIHQKRSYKHHGQNNDEGAIEIQYYYLCSRFELVQTNLLNTRTQNKSAAKLDRHYYKKFTV